VELRRQIFRQMCQKARRILCGFAGMVGAWDGKDAGKTVPNASAANCAVLHKTGIKETGAVF